MKREILVSDETYLLIGLMVHSVMVDLSAEYGVLSVVEAAKMKQRALEKINRKIADSASYYKLLDELMDQLPPPLVRDRDSDW